MKPAPRSELLCEVLYGFAHTRLQISERLVALVNRPLRQLLAPRSTLLQYQKVAPPLGSAVSNSAYSSRVVVAVIRSSSVGVLYQDPNTVQGMFRRDPSFQERKC